MKWAGGAGAPLHSGNSLYVLFILLVPLTLSPSTILALTAPLVFLLFLCHTSNDRSFLRVAVLAGTISVISLTSVFIDSQILHRDVSVPALLFGIIHYLPIIIAVSVLPPAVGKSVRDRAVNSVALITIVECLIGVRQYVLTRDADTVGGTIGFGPPGMDQVLFTFNLFGFVLFLIPYIRQSVLVMLAVGLAVVTIALAQSGHQTIMFGVSIILSSLVGRKIRFGKIAVMLGLAALAFGLLVAIHPSTLVGVREWYKKSINPETSLKLAVLAEAMEVLARPKNAIIGTGLGQFGSRSAIVASNDWVQMDIPAALTGKSEYFERRIEPLLVRHKEFGEGSAISKPHFSALNLVVEFGTATTAVFLAALVVAFRNNVGLQSSHSKELRDLAWSLRAGVLFFLFVSFIENYAEFVQGIFLPVLLYIMAKGRIKALQIEALHARDPVRLVDGHTLVDNVFRRA